MHNRSWKVVVQGAVYGLPLIHSYWFVLQSHKTYFYCWAYEEGRERWKECVIKTGLGLRRCQHEQGAQIQERASGFTAALQRWVQEDLQCKTKQPTAVPGCWMSSVNHSGSRTMDERGQEPLSPVHTLEYSTHFLYYCDTAPILNVPVYVQEI
jgi:hypothetical protein